ncbi:hypothetical protein [Bradyrhizobium sp. BR 10261]|uniref:hypothetical protein n=1 Tax=Bradyrhizobium sp. BR 10261 TaxID=2749992 RepID=UPI001C6487B5|nr:hypothetical protein [Bradyrhizobium sp. BR 10261]MBW7961116.1 hypothetical protein [Bradyrhizobium sp. BR 10261]
MASIFLVNPISGRGHLDAYARLYSRALLELGHRVVLVAQTDAETISYLARNAPALAPSFAFFSVDQPNRGGTAGTESITWTQLVSKNGALDILLRSIGVRYGKLRSQMVRIKRALGRRLLETEFARALNLRFHSDVSRISFNPALDCIDTVASISGEAAPDLILFLYLDMMAEQPRNIAVLDRPQSAPWAGILFHPRLISEPTKPVEGYFKSAKARGGLFLVPSAIPAYAKAAPNLHFALAPDVADLELPTEPSELAREIRKRAGDRTVVLQIGSIAAHKGIATLLDVIAAADPARFFFAIIGKANWESFDEHRSRIRSFYANPPKNVFLFEGYIASEPDYNSIIQACDILYAVYQGFNSSSNSLTKAAGFRRPILVTEDSLMGKRVHRLKIGACAPEGNVDTILEKLGWLAGQPKDTFDFDAFQDEQSIEALKSTLSKALGVWLSAAASTSPHLPRN